MTASGVSSVAFRVIRNAVGIRYDRGEGSISALVSEYNKLSASQQEQIIAYWKAKGKE